MKKLVCVVVMLFCIGTSVSAKGYEIRVGLESICNKKDVCIMNNTIQLGYNKNFTLTLNSKTGFKFCADNSNYKMTEQIFDSYQAAINCKSKDDVVYTDGTIWRLCTKDTEKTDDTSAKLLLHGENDIVFAKDIRPQIKCNDDELIKLSTRKYRGIMEFGIYNEKFMAVNVLPLEEYLYSVVPSEMPSSWSIEALKAQTVAARTYAMAKLKLDNDYDVCDTVHCQVYLGAGNESARARKAVDDTKGICATYNNKLISSVFFSSSGGMTEDSENVWGNAVPYLRSVPDIYDEAKSWSYQVSMDDIKKLLSENKIDIGELVEITPLDFTQAGRVSSLDIVGTNGDKCLTKEDIRNFFAKANGILPSRMFTVDSIGVISLSDFKDKLNKIVINGKGNGHGVGMSQYGAKGMAEAGFTYDKILKYYYTGIDLNYV